MSQNGIDLAISLLRGTLLRDGDMLEWDEAQGTESPESTSRK